MSERRETTRIRVPVDVSPCPLVLLVRHTALHPSIRGICYGRSDVPLAENAEHDIAAVLARRAGFAPDVVVHSDVTRTRLLGQALASACKVPVVADGRLGEIDYGSWQGRRWDDIYADVGAEMDRIVSEPETYAPGGGETLFAARDRLLSWLGDLGTYRRVLAVTHGGSMGIMWGALGGMPVARWGEYAPNHGAGLLIENETAACDDADCDDMV